MKKLAITLLLTSILSAHASDSLVCKTVADANESITYNIDITADQINMVDDLDTLTTWNRTENSNFDYYALDANGAMEVGEYIEIKTVLLYITDGVNLVDLAKGEEFKMRISFAKNIIEYDDSDLISYNYYNCKKQ